MPIALLHFRHMVHNQQAAYALISNEYIRATANNPHRDML
jgi:hypothetical protein